MTFVSRKKSVLIEALFLRIVFLAPREETETFEDEAGGLDTTL